MWSGEREEWSGEREERSESMGWSLEFPCV